MLFFLLFLYFPQNFSNEFYNLWSKSLPQDTLEAIVILKEKPTFDSEGNRQEKLHYLVDFTGETQKELVNYLKRLGAFKIHQFFIVNGFYIKAERSVFDSLAKRSEVETVYPNDIISIGRPPVRDPIEPEERPYGIRLIGADSVWIKLGYTGEGVVVGNIDTGVDVDHPALSSKFLGYFYDAVNHHSYPYDDHGHGTHTMGTILGGDGPFNDFPPSHDVGVAPGARFVAAKAFNSQGYGSAYLILSCMDYMASLIDSGVDIRIVSNSWGSNFTQNTYFFEATLNWRELGIIPVFSIGNNGPEPNTAGIPGNYPTVIGVGAVNSDTNVAYFSSRGPSPQTEPWNNEDYWPREDWNFIKPDISAPGVNVYSTLPGDGYGYMSGTSMAAPHIAGAIALLLEAKPHLTFKDVYYLLTERAKRLSGHSYPNNNEGFGILNIYEVLKPCSVVARITFSFTPIFEEGKSAIIPFHAESEDSILRVKLFLSYNGDSFPDTPVASITYSEHPVSIDDYFSFIVPGPPTQNGALLLKVYSLEGAEGADTLHNVTVLLGAPSVLTYSFTYPSDSLLLTWEDGSSYETGFILERKKEDGEFVEIAQLPPNSTSYVDYGVVPYTVYTYRLRAESGIYNSPSVSCFAPTCGWFEASLSPSFRTSSILASAYIFQNSLILEKFDRFGRSIFVDTLAEEPAELIKVGNDHVLYITGGGRFLKHCDLTSGDISLIFDGGTNLRVEDMAYVEGDMPVVAVLLRTVHLPFYSYILITTLDGNDALWDTVFVARELLDKVKLALGGELHIAYRDSARRIGILSQNSIDTVLNVNSEDFDLIATQDGLYIVNLQDSILQIFKRSGGMWIEEGTIDVITGRYFILDDNTLSLTVYDGERLRFFKWDGVAYEYSYPLAVKDPVYAGKMGGFEENLAGLKPLWIVDRYENRYVVRVRGYERFFRRYIGGVQSIEKEGQLLKIEAFPSPAGESILFRGIASGTSELLIYRLNGALVKRYPLKGEILRF